MIEALQTSRWLQYLYFLRVSIFGWLLLIAFALLDWGGVTSSLSRGILTLDSGWQAFYASFFVVALHLTALITARNTARNGEDRFLTPPPPALARALTDSTTRLVWITLALSQLPTAFFLWYLSHNAHIEAEQYSFIGLSSGNIWFFFLFGGIAALLFWYLVSLFYYWTYRPSQSQPRPVPSALIFPHNLFGDIANATPPARFASLAEWLTRVVLRFSYPGYAENSNGPLWELHFLSSLAVVGILLVYLFLYPLTGPVPSTKLTLGLQIALCLGITGAFLYLISDATYGGLAPGRSCRWAHPVKWTFTGFAIVVAGLFLAVLIDDQRTGSVLMEMAFPTLASILVLAIFFVWFFSGATFFFDRYRLPVLTVVLAIILIPKLAGPRISRFFVGKGHPWVAQVFDSDHYFSVNNLGEALPLEAIPTPAQAFETRAPKDNQVSIVVTASGGGIQAAEWTSQVLAALETSFANDPELQKRSYTFHDHLVLASGVSGGSVGLLPYLLEYTARDSPHGDKTFFPASPPALNSSPLALADRITRPPRCSSLEAVGWGLVYHDLFRLITPIRIPGSLASDSEPDRSWALAAAINRNLHDIHCQTDAEHLEGLPAISDGKALTLEKAAEMLSSGALPAFTFNTTAAETGSRFLLSNYHVPAPDLWPSSLRATDPQPYNDFIPAESFLQVYSADPSQRDASVKPMAYADLPLATAARLSATFPIVSSGTRIPLAYTAHAYHFLDGGYFDNDGTASAIEFLKSAVGNDGANGKHLKILLIEIRDDDGQQVTTDSDALIQQNASSAPPWTPVTQATGVFEGLWNAGHVSISRRNRRELCIFETAYPHVEIHHIVFTIPDGTDGLSPLSWNLTSGQLGSILDRRNSDQTKAAIAEAVKWVNDRSSATASSATDPCTAWIEPPNSTFESLKMP